MRRIQAHGASAIPLVDPFSAANATCLSMETFPAESKCVNFDLFLASAVPILVGLATSERLRPAIEAPARGLLWQMLHDPTVDVFDLSRHSEWSRTDGDALRRVAQSGLDLSMVMPDDRRFDVAASRPGAVSALGEGIGWVLQQSCAGVTMLQGCDYASRVFSMEGNLLSSRLIPAESPENIGAAVTVDLHLLPRAGSSTIGAIRAVGGFGGDLERVVLYSLGRAQEPLCEFAAAAGSRDLLGRMGEMVDLSSGRCALRPLPDGVRAREFPSDTAADSRGGRPPPVIPVPPKPIPQIGR